MAARFNPPPGWPPAPEGWTPPPGWSPDPSWPAAPPGWQLWVDESGAGQAAPAGDVSRFSGAPDSGAPTQPFAAQGSVNPNDPAQTAVFQKGAFGAPAPGAPQGPGFGGPPPPGGPVGPGGWQQPGQPSGSKPKAWLIPVIIGVVALLAVLGILFATGVIGGGDDEKKADPTTQSTEATDDPTEKEPTDGPTEKEPTEKPTTAAPTDKPTAGAGDNGSRSAPLAPNETAEIWEWTVSMAASNLDAWAEIQPGLSEYQLENYAPPAGQTYVMAPVTVTFNGDDRESLWDLDWVYIGANGSTYEDSCSYVDLPNELDTGQELYTDGSATGNICVTVPSDQVADGVWRVSSWGDYDDDYEAYFATQ